MDMGAPTPAPPPTAKMLPDRYRVLGELGRGGMGIVYHALDTRESRDVAIKMLSARAGDDPVAFLRFNREARTASSLSHPNVCQVFEVDEYRGRPYLVMELLEGDTLKARLAKGNWGTERVLDVVRQIAMGLAAAHDGFIVHRDIKPANVFITISGAVKILDFGLAKHFAGIRTSDPITVTEPGHTPGTVDYMSPEQLLGRRLDQRSDLFSLGVLTYELLTGRSPFRGASSVETMAGILNGSVPPLPILSFAKEWGDILDRLLAKDADERYPTARALLDDLSLLERIARGDDVAWLRGGPSAAKRRLPSVAVIPFETAPIPQSHDEQATNDVAFFGHGLVDELIGGFSRIKGLRVVPRTLTLTATAERTELASIGRSVHADRVLSGTIESRDDRLIVNATLIDVRGNAHIWKKRYLRRTEELFQLRDEIVRDVAAEFRLPTFRVGGIHPPEVRSRQAFQLCLKGRFYWGQRYSDGLNKAHSCFSQAIALDPELALGHAGLADTYSFLGFYSLKPPRRMFEEALKASQRALELDPELAEAHTSLGLVRLGGEWAWEEARRSFERALELDPNNGLARTFLAWVHVLLGNITEAHQEAERAQDLDPLSPTLNAGAGYTFFLSRSYERSIRECEKALEINSNFLVALYVMALSQGQLGLYAEAITALERAVAVTGDMPFYLCLLGKMYAENDQEAEANRIVDRLEKMAASGAVYVAPHAYVYVHTGLRNYDKAFDWQEKAFVDGASPFNYFSPALERLHGDSRFWRDVSKFGITAETY